MLFNTESVVTAAASVVQMPTDKTRRKRLKVVSACSECRRKKTKCNGEKPCAGCIKTNMDCKYSNSPKSKVNNSNTSNNNRPIATTTTTSTNYQRTVVENNNTTTNSLASSIPTTTTTNTNTTTIINPNTTTNNINTSNSVSSNASATIHAIENRLTVIEDILKVLLLSTNNNVVNTEQQQRNSAFHHHHQQQQQQQQQQHLQHKPQRNMQVHSGPYYGEMYNSSSNAFQPQQSYQETNTHVGYHRSLNKRRHSGDDDDVDEVDSYYSATSPTIVSQQSSDILVRNPPPVTYNVRLPPPLNYQPSLSESSSTSTTSSICSSNSSPKINTIQTLLNNVKQEDFKYHHHRPSAFSTVEVVNRSY